MPYTLTVDLAPAQEFVTALPAWAWAVTAACVWYPGFGVFMKKTGARKEINDTGTLVFAWILSPMLMVLFLGFMAGWTVCWAASGTLIPPPWDRTPDAR